jgi:hypothetical protein
MTRRRPPAPLTLPSSLPLPLLAPLDPDPDLLLRIAGGLRVGGLLRRGVGRGVGRLRGGVGLGVGRLRGGVGLGVLGGPRFGVGGRTGDGKLQSLQNSNSSSSSVQGEQHA